ncbi:MAG: hypothetical protein HZA49_02785 [Planctomycetes bacterium]|nr:hypothetical protein [Planctomycetota bacterium]
MNSTKVIGRAFTVLVLGMAIAAFYMGACGGSKGDSGSSASAGSPAPSNYVVYIDNPTANITGSDYSGVLKSAPIISGTPITLDNVTDNRYRKITPDGAKVVYLCDVIWSSGIGTLKVVPINGGTPITLASGVSAYSYSCYEISSDSTKVFYIDGADSLGIGNLKSVAIGGGTPTTISTNATMVNILY